MAKATRMRCLVSVASVDWAYSTGQSVEVGAPGHVDAEEAERLLAAYIFEVDTGEARETATRPAGETATTPRRRRRRKPTT